MCYINARSVRNKIIFLNDFISTHNCDLFAISETWLGCEATNDIHINSILPDDYMMHHVDRNSERRGGGIAWRSDLINYPNLLNLNICHVE